MSSLRPRGWGLRAPLLRPHCAAATCAGDAEGRHGGDAGGWENAEKEWRFYWEKFGKTWEHMGKPSIWGWDFGLLPGKTRGFLWNFGGFCLETLVIGIVSSFCQQQLGLKQQTLRNMRGWTSKHLDLRIHKWVVFVYGLGNNILIGLIARNLSELFDDHCCVILINSALADLDQERFMKLHKRLLIAKHCALLGQGPAVIAWNHWWNLAGSAAVPEIQDPEAMTSFPCVDRM